MDTELPDDQFEGVTIDVYRCWFVQNRCSLTCRKKHFSELSVQTKVAFENYLNAKPCLK